MPKPLDTTQASANRLSGKSASDAFKKGDNSGMLFKKEAKASTNIAEYRAALEKQRMRETSSNSNDLRNYK